MRATITKGTGDINPQTAREYYDLWQNSRAVREDFDSLFWVDRSIARYAPEFGAPQLYTTLRRCFGESTTMYDDWKCSFGYPFELQVAKGERNSTHLMLFSDYKGGLSFRYRRVCTADEPATTTVDSMSSYLPENDEFSCDDMRIVTGFIVGFLLGCWKATTHTVTEDYARTNDAALLIYGVRDQAPFERSHDDYNEYIADVQELIRSGISLNVTRSNAPVPQEARLSV